MYGYANHRVTLDALTEFAWSAPMRDLATQVGISDVGLKKLLKSYDVVLPPQGHWNRVHAGRTVPDPPKAPPRRPGENAYILVDQRMKMVPQIERPSSAGPFATKEVPEDLQELRQREAAAIGRAASARRLESPVEAVRGALRHDERERERAAEKSWHTAVLLFESPYDQRRLRILNAIFLTLAKRRHSGWISCRDNWPEFGVTIGHTNVDLILDENPKKVAAYNRHQHPGPDPKRAASTLILQAGESVWQDDGAGKLETKIADICAGLIVEGERAYRKGLREAEEQDERWRAYEEKKRQEELARANAERLTALLESGRLLSEAEALRRLIAQVSAAVEAGGVLLEQHELTSWREWAEGQADAVDPIKSGQVAKHLRPPSG